MLLLSVYNSWLAEENRLKLVIARVELVKTTVQQEVLHKLGMENAELLVVSMIQKDSKTERQLNTRMLSGKKNVKQAKLTFRHI